MSFRNTTTSYGSIAKFFHWVIAILIIFQLVFGYFLEDFPKDVQPFTYNLHKLTGLTILALMVLRGLWALINVKPVPLANAPSWQRFIEKMVHYSLYIFAILMPLSGWIGSVAGGHPPQLGNFEFTLPISPNSVLDEAAFNVHGTSAIILIVLISVHVLAALYHQFIKKDNVLKRMLPSCRHC